MEKQILNSINDLCGDNGVTTFTEIALNLNITYGKAKYWTEKLYKSKHVGIIYPGLGMGRNTERLVYNKACSI